MDKLLTIAVPRYRETEPDIFPLLSSISNQVGLDLDSIEIIIVTDGEGNPPLDEMFLSLFDLDIKQLQLTENRGCGPARQAAIDIASGKYILCCDADDMLYSVTSLAALLSDAENTDADLLVSDFIEEIRDLNGNISFKLIQPAACWMHGKLLRRDFLQEKNIRFLPDLRDHEDSYFLGVAMALADNLRYLQVPTYLWRYNADSITRRNNHAYVYTKHPEYVQAVTLAFHNISRSKPELISARVVQFVHYNYFLLHRSDWLEPDRKTLLQNAEQAFTEYMAPFMDHYRNTNPDDIAANYNEERTKNFCGVESEPVSAWLKRLGLL